ncbi:hypothetical protein Pcinc_041992 [Petrolisthes cinctipes]|uniref:Uncharacterized protein n=1 Tax=Petrolisthes cinctipes TaxID=88211 RepID=A0AAE1BIH3_PETCI|nr:hypothetical protein Pcinc_041992 [Petrolisthes cinctipes]
MIIGTLGQLERRTGRGGGGGRCSGAAGLSEPVVVTAGGVLAAHWSNTLLTQVPQTSMAQSNPCQEGAGPLLGGKRLRPKLTSRPCLQAVAGVPTHGSSRK